MSLGLQRTTSGMATPFGFFPKFPPVVSVETRLYSEVNPVPENAKWYLISVI